MLLARCIFPNIANFMASLQLNYHFPPHFLLLPHGYEKPDFNLISTLIPIEQMVPVKALAFSLLIRTYTTNIFLVRHSDVDHSRFQIELTFEHQSSIISSAASKPYKPSTHSPASMPSHYSPASIMQYTSSTTPISIDAVNHPHSIYHFI